MAYRFSFEYWSNYGDSKNDLYDENYIYDLPYNKSLMLTKISLTLYRKLKKAEVP